jgi:hypothetical protein
MTSTWKLRNKLNSNCKHYWIFAQDIVFDGDDISKFPLEQKQVNYRTYAIKFLFFKTKENIIKDKNGVDVRWMCVLVRY